MNDIERPAPVRDLAQGIAVRAAVLGAGGLIVGTVLFTTAAKVASGVVKVLTGLVLVSAGAGLAAWEIKKARRRFAARA